MSEFEKDPLNLTENDGKKLVYSNKISRNTLLCSPK